MKTETEYSVKISATFVFIIILTEIDALSLPIRAKL